VTRALAVLVVLAAVLAAGCSHGMESQSAQDVLAETSQNLGDVKSGDLGLNLLFSAKGGDRAGFNLEGPFQLTEGQLPEAQLDYTQIAGSSTTTQTFVLKDGKAYVRMGGTTYQLPATATGQISSSLGNSGGLATIDLSNWVRDPQVSDGGEVGGVDTDKVSGRLNVATVVSGLVAVASQFGGTTPLTPLSGQSAEQVAGAVRSASIDVYTGKEDRLLRKVDISIDFAPAAAKVKELLGASVHFTLAISDPNEPVTVETPTNAQPYSPGG
jgi:hypothetical protein